MAEKLSEYRQGGVEVVQNALSPNFRSENYARENCEDMIVGYFGHLTSSWFDWDALKEIAKIRSKIIFEIIGHSEPKDLKLPENIILLGPKNHAQINNIAARWSAAIIPFKTGPLADAVDPIKIYEYLSLGLPTVSFSMPQIDGYPETETANDVESFVKSLDRAIKRKTDQKILDNWLQKNRWEDRVDIFDSWNERRMEMWK